MVSADSAAAGAEKKFALGGWIIILSDHTTRSLSCSVGFVGKRIGNRINAVEVGKRHKYSLFVSPVADRRRDANSNRFSFSSCFFYGYEFFSCVYLRGRKN